MGKWILGSEMRYAAPLAALAAVAGLSLAAQAQQPPATPKPGYVLPPENAGGLYPVNGEPIYKSKCAACHDNGVNHAPTLTELAGHSPEDVYEILTNGVMKPMAAGLSEVDLYGVVYYLTGKPPVLNKITGPDSNPCKTDSPLQPAAPQWNGWSNSVRNERYQPNAGFKTTDIPRLKVKWAFSYPGTKNTEPLIWGGRVYAGSFGGEIYSLDAKTGCVHWRHDFKGAVRASMTIGADPNAPSKYALYYGDDRTNVTALDAQSGKELWTTHTGVHSHGRITGSPTLYNGVLYVPQSGQEESLGGVASYECCTFIGAVAAVDAITGKVLWYQPITDDKPRPTRKNSAGTQLYGPAGGSIWNAPTIDAKRGQLYVATGDSFTEIPFKGADAVVAMDLNTGKVRWINQVKDDDNFGVGFNVPLGVMGPDWDFGASPILANVAGKDLLLAGNKSSVMYAMDPATGKTVWENRLGRGGASGGIMWGPATDGKVVYTPVADPGPAAGAEPGVVALNAVTGKEIWRYDAPKDLPCNVPSGKCPLAFTSAATLVPGALFAGADDGRIRAFNAANGKVLWEYDTTTPIDTVNGIKNAPGGSLAMGGPTIAGGMMFMHSGYSGSAGPNNLLLAFSVDGK
jgi:polyvinyl alcohol dehydrogenase (cytochrome)